MLLQRRALSAGTGRAPGQSSRPVVTMAAAAPAAPTPSAKKVEPVINLIPNNGIGAGRAVNGIPPVMGAHLMASGVAAPLSVSKGPGLDVFVHPFQYPTVAGSAQIVVHSSKATLGQDLVQQVLKAANAAIASHGAFTLVLSGGSVLPLLGGLVAEEKGTQWNKWHVFFVDERNVPHSSADSTYKAAREAFLARVPIPAGQVHAIHEGLPVGQAAVNYEGRLIGLPEATLPRTADKALPAFDLIILGVGPDGHVASLFPNTAATAAVEGWVQPVKNSPKPPAERISMTMPVINAAKEVFIVAFGAEKAEVVQRTLEVQSLPGALPAQMVRPSNGSLQWFLDEQSAQKLSVKDWENTKAYPRSQ